MSSIFGFAWLDGRPCSPESTQGMARAATAWGPDDVATWQEGSATLGRSLLQRTPEDCFDTQPVVDWTARVAITAAGRLDNRDELLSDLDANPHEDADATLMARAYARWQDEAPRRFTGDWAFAAWHPQSRRLVLARDQLGCTALYYWHRPPLIAFASDLNVLLALPEVARRVDDDWLLRYLTMSSPGALDRTLYEGVRAVLPAQQLIVDERGITARTYWSPRDTKTLPRASQRDHLEGFLAQYRRAVRVRLRSTRPIASMLSSGLDSGSVTALAAEALLDQGQPLTALTAVPAGPIDAHRIAADDEGDLAAETAARWGNVSHIRVDAADVGVMASLERSATVFPLPVHGPGNLHWFFGVLDAARARGHRVLLCGQAGNATVSWTGGACRVAHLLREAPFSRGWPALVEWRAQTGASWTTAMRRHIAGPLLGQPVRRLHAAWRPRQEAWRAWGAPHAHLVPRFEPVFASGLRPHDERARLLELVSVLGGRGHQAHATASGIDLRDPTADVRLTEYCMGLPDDCYAHGTERSLLKDGFAGLIPDRVLHAPVKARQAADLGRRLSATAIEVDAMIERLSANAVARAYIDFEAIRAAWTDLERDRAPDVETTRAKVTRGLMAALCLARL